MIRYTSTVRCGSWNHFRMSRAACALCEYVWRKIALQDFRYQVRRAVPPDPIRERFNSEWSAVCMTEVLFVACYK
jgi:hypothetical protein